MRVGNNQFFQRGTYRSIQIGASLYQTRHPQEVWNYGPGKSWLAVSASEQTGLTSADPFSILKAVSGPFMRIGAATIRGVVTTEYVDSATLAAVMAATGATSGPIGTTDPPLKQIPVQVIVWIDAQHRVRQISTWEPYYTLNYKDGASAGGEFIVTQSPTPTPDGPPRQQGFVETTLDLWQFGTRVHIAPPPAAEVATPR